jgi:hypothetical protein
VRQPLTDLRQNLSEQGLEALRVDAPSRHEGHHCIDEVLLEEL